ncbi:POC1 centriolar protein A [Ceratobasidium sp. 395]|nr:POC1 centriolar protein A [Ceratobasidium sp. 395]
MATRQFLSTTGDIAIELLRLTAAAADVFPPLKSVASGALHIAEIVQRFHANKDEWRELGKYAQDATASVVQSLAQVNHTNGEIVNNLGKLQTVLDEITRIIESEQALPRFNRIMKFMQDQEVITKMKDRINDSIRLFQLSTTTISMIDVGKTFDAVLANGKTLSNIAQDTSFTVVKVSAIDQKALLLGMNATLDKLPRVQGASWDPSRGCMGNTRVELIDEIIEWVNRPNNSDRDSQPGGAKIFLLTAVAGAGKSTVAHTVARICHERKQLGFSFFFDRETDGRNSPTALLTTIAADLSRLDRRLSERLTRAIEEDRSLLLAPLSRQFQELLLKPCMDYHSDKPTVIVIDALDEAPSEELLDILHDHVSRLPSNFRIFLTSRMGPELGTLLNAAHVTNQELNVNAQPNLDDMKVYAPAKLQQFARKRRFQANWPGEQMRAEFIAKAGGLFLWVATVCEYLHNYDDPTEELQQLLLASGYQSSSAEDQMRKLYARVLGGFNWGDDRFVASYRRVMGTAIATKTPLTISAMRELYHDTPLASEFTLHRLSSLLTGMRKEDHECQPVRVLHQSLRDFLVDQDTHSSSEAAKFTIVEKEQSRMLALLSLELINRGLIKTTTPGTGYLGKGEKAPPGIPKLDRIAIPEGLQYACLFWQSHIMDARDSTQQIEEALGRFLDNKVTLWMEVVAVYGPYRGLSVARKWIEVSMIGDGKTTVVPAYQQVYAEASLTLCDHLEYEDRREEALEASSEALQTYRLLAASGAETNIQDICRSLASVAFQLSSLGRREEALAASGKLLQLHRQLTVDQPGLFTPALALCLNNISFDLANMGRRKEALAAIEEAIQLRRQLVANRPAAFIPELATSLNNQSVYLSEMGHREEALAAVEEAVQLRRKLAADRPTEFLPGLATSLNNLSVRLSAVGRHEEALAMIREAIQIYQRLAANRPATFTPLLARSLNNLSNRLFGLGSREEALTAIEEAVLLRRQLATERPAAFIPSLAKSLHNLSLSMSDFGRNDEALSIIQEAVILWRPLAANFPLRFNLDLKLSLIHLSNVLSDMGLHEEAVVANAETKDILV